ncbi:MAG: hypothetical protein ABI620_08015 [Chloroflexota bacterium]
MSILRTAALALVIAVVAACTDAAPGSAPPTATVAPEPTPVSRTYELGTQVWYEGLVITFDRVSSLLDARGGTVDLLVGIANPNADATQLDAAITLSVGDVQVEPTRDSVVPEVPGNGSVATVLTFELQAIPSVDAGTFEVGATPDHIARVPITPAAGEPVTFEPQALALKGSAQASTLKLTLKGGVLRWDLPDWTEELKAKLQVLTVTYEVTYTGDFAGGLAFTGVNVALKLPDGTVVSARRDGHSQSVELIGAHKTKKGLFSRFEIPAGMTGTFTLLVRMPGTEKTIKFAIGG